jgi:hypothetical protein
VGFGAKDFGRVRHVRVSLLPKDMIQWATSYGNTYTL